MMMAMNAMLSIEAGLFEICTKATCSGECQLQCDHKLLVELRCKITEMVGVRDYCIVAYQIVLSGQLDDWSEVYSEFKQRSLAGFPHF